MLIKQCFGGVEIHGATPEEILQIQQAMDDYNAVRPADQLGDRLAAEIILRDYGRRIVVPNEREWFGLNRLEYDGKLKRVYR